MILFSQTQNDPFYKGCLAKKLTLKLDFPNLFHKYFTTALNMDTLQDVAIIIFHKKDGQQWKSLSKLHQIYHETVVTFIFCKQCFHFLKLKFTSNFQKGNLQIDFPRYPQNLPASIIVFMELTQE